MRRLRRFLIRTWPLLLSLALLAAAPLALQTTREGRAAVDASLYLPDMVVQVPLPLRPVELVSRAPSRERITLEYTSRDGPRTIEADLYVPQGGGTRPGVVFSMGAPPLELDSPRLVRIAEDAARAGVVMLVPFSERLDDHRIEPEEIDALVAEFEYVRALPYVDPDRVGFFGASVGGSLALVAAADPRISAHVEYLVSFGGYYDALETFGDIATRHIEYGGVDESWDANVHSEEVMAEQLINELDDPRDRELLWQWFVDDAKRPPQPAQVATLSSEGRIAYDFIANEDPARVSALIDRLPRDWVENLRDLSPSTSIDRVRAELFIIHDVADPFVPYTESRKLDDDLRGRAGLHYQELRLFEHVEPKLTQRPNVVVLDSARLLYRLYQLVLKWH